MKTTDELYREAQQLLEEKKRKRAEERAEIEAQREAIKRAECAAQSAIESGDAEAYTQAQQAITFAAKRAENLQQKYEKNKNHPVREYEYYMQLKRQLETAHHSELKPLYEDLAKRVKGCSEIYQKIMAVHTVVNRTKALVCDTLPSPQPADWQSPVSFTQYGLSGLGAFRGNALEEELNGLIQGCDRQIELFSK